MEGAFAPSWSHQPYNAHLAVPHAHLSLRRPVDPNQDKPNTNPIEVPVEVLIPAYSDPESRTSWPGHGWNNNPMLVILSASEGSLALGNEILRWRSG